MSENDSNELPPTLKVPAVQEPWSSPLAQSVDGLGATLSQDVHYRPQLAPSLSGPMPPGYEILEELGRGGMGVVYKARQINLNRLVALKMILAGTFATAGDVRRLNAEAEAVAHLDDLHIVPVYEIGEHEGHHYLSMKLVDGGTLAQHISRLIYDHKRAASIVAKVARAVHHAHQRGVLHRDLKPANILLDSAGEPFVADFGLAKRVDANGGMTNSGSILGTPHYMSPEQTSGDKGAITTLSDVYSLGAVLYEILTGRPPFDGHNVFEIMRQVRDEALVKPRSHNPLLDRGLEAICLKCLEKAPHRRYPSAMALAEDLEHWQTGERIQAKLTGTVAIMWFWLRRNSRSTFWALAIGLLLGILGPQLGMLLPLIVQVIGFQSKLYSTIPGSQLPWIAQLGISVPSWLAHTLLALGIFLQIAAGLLVHVLVRPKDKLAEIGAATLIGLVAGGLAFTVLIGPLGVGTTFYTGINRDVHHLGDNVPIRLLEGKRNAGICLSFFPIFWVGMPLTLAIYLFVGLGETLIAGRLLRANGKLIFAVVPYLELVTPCSILAYYATIMVCLERLPELTEQYKWIRSCGPQWQLVIVTVLLFLVIVSVLDVARRSRRR